MTIYNINKGIGWASSGVEYAQAYRAGIFRHLGIPSKFIFTDMFQAENLQHFTENIGITDDQVLWLYSFFTDIKIASSSYPLEKLEETFSTPIREKQVNQQLIRYTLEQSSYQVVVVLKKGTEDCVQRVEYLSPEGQLIRKDYYSYTKIFSEFFVTMDEKLQLVQRTFYNEDGQVAFEENMAFGGEFFEFPDRTVYSKEDLIGRMLDELNLTDKDIILLDRSTGIGQGVFEHKGLAKLAIVIHAEHYNAKSTTEQNILWNNYYEYQFSNADKVDAFITSTEAQKTLLEEQFKQYTSFDPKVYAIPVGSLETLRITGNPRRKYSLMTASRLASEKHIDWLVRAVVKARETFPVTLDIYGEGGQRGNLTDLIEALGAKDYIHLKGHHSLDEVYRDYEVYLTASTSEGFGLTLLEAIGSGLAMIGLDVPYGNQTFIKEGKNGYLVPRLEPDDAGIVSTLIADRILYMYEEGFMKQAAIESYDIASGYLRSVLEKKWTKFVEELTHD